jgi:SAM-dependent methyltransferase
LETGSRLATCPLCRGQTREIGLVRGPRTGRVLPVVECADCRSLFNPSGYREQESDLRADSEYLNRHFERSSSYYLDLIKTIVKLRPGIREHLDVGCGAAPMVYAGGRRGLQSEGLDLNPFAIESAVARGLSARCERLMPNQSGKRYDLVTCDQVLEHIEDPRSFLSTLSSHVAESGMVFINVPYRPPAALTPFYLRYPRAWTSPFLDNDVHINHFSHRAMTTVVKELLGMRWLVPFYGARNNLARLVRWGLLRVLDVPRGYLYGRSE